MSSFTQTNTPDILSILRTLTKRFPAQATLDMIPAARSTTNLRLTGFLTDGTIEAQARISLDTSSINPWPLTQSASLTRKDKVMLSPEKCTWKPQTLMADLTQPNGLLRIRKEPKAKDLITKVSVYRNNEDLDFIAILKF